MKKIFFLIVFTLQFSIACFAQDPYQHYTDREIIKLVNYIKKLEKTASFYIATHPDDVFVKSLSNNKEEKTILLNIVTDTFHSYNDNQVIKIANYIKGLLHLDSLNTYSLAIIKDNKKRVDDSIAKSKTFVMEEQKEIDNIEKSIFFNFDSSILKEESYKPLNEIVEIFKSYINLTPVIKNYSGIKFIIEGHTDSIGPIAYNLNLSNERAKSVADYFISKGIPDTILSFNGYGEAKPIDTNETQEGQAKNRRVEIRAKK